MMGRRFWAFGIMVTLAVLLTGVVQAKADTFDFTYTDSNYKVTGTLTGNQNPANSGQWDVTGGSATLNGTTYTLLQNINYPTVVLSPDGAINYDDVLFTLQPQLDGVGGLLFIAQSGSELNIWGNGTPVNYALYGEGAGLSINDYVNSGEIQYNGTGTFTATDVPETSSLFLLGVGLVGVSAAFSKRYRKV